jgi:two-component system sensor histidine kinase YesM
LIDYKGRPIYIINDFYSPNSNIIITLQDFNSAQQIKENILDASAFSKDYFLGKDNINVYMKNTNLELYIVAQYSLQKYYESQNSAIFLIQTFFTVILLFLILFYILLMYIFYKLKSNIRQVGEIINNNFEGRLKVTGRDELQKNAAQINEMLVNIRELISKIISKEKLAYDAEMKALLNQINPHFIYNTINIFIMKLEVEGSFEVAEAIAKFGKILRYNIETNSELTTIKEDVAVLKDYMDLLKLRFDDEFSYIVDIPPDILDSKILRFVLQPIVENCFKHGRQAGKHLCISIYAVRDNRDIRIYINDNGRGMSQLLIDALNQAFETSNYQSIKKITRKMNGNIGLMNTNERIKLHYGNEYHLSVEGKEDSYSTFIIHLKSEE